MPTETESDIQRAIIDIARLAGWLALRLNAGVAWSADGARPIRLAPAGWPDLALVGPGGRLVWCEVKRPGRRLRPAQAALIAQLRGLGHTVIVATSVDDVVGALGLLL